MLLQMKNGEAVPNREAIFMSDTPRGEAQYVCQDHRCTDHRDKKDPACDHAGCVQIAWEPWMEQYRSTMTIVPETPEQPAEEPSPPDEEA
jgi:hypothetical protein